MVQADDTIVHVAPRDRLIVALDVPDVKSAEALIDQLGDAVTFYKIGYQLAYAGGLPLVRELVSARKRVFADLKLHDIGNTVARGVESVAKLGATFLTVHAYPQTMQAAIEGRAGSALKILAVTVLTSYDDSDMHAAGYRFGVAEMVEARARQAHALGIDGLVSSAEEVSDLRKIVGMQMILVTPGIRPAGSDAGDQKQFVTPERAIASGADYLVVGRPITAARDPKNVAEQIVATIEEAMNQGLREETMAKGYWIGRVEVSDEEGYKPYAAANPAIFKKFGARFVIRGGKFECPEGQSRSRNVVIEFPDYATALACYNSPEYQANAKIRQTHAITDLIIVEGYDGVQP